MTSWVPASASRLSCTPEPAPRSEEHTSELQSHLNLVCRLLLEKKNDKISINNNCLESLCISTVWYPRYALSPVPTMLSQQHSEFAQYTSRSLLNAYCPLLNFRA